MSDQLTCLKRKHNLGLTFPDIIPIFYVTLVILVQLKRQEIFCVGVGTIERDFMDVCILSVIALYFMDISLTA